MPKLRPYREYAIMDFIYGGISEHLSTYLASHQSRHHMGYLRPGEKSIQEVLVLPEEVQEQAAVHPHLAKPGVPELSEEVVDLGVVPPSQLRAANRRAQGLLPSDLHRALVVGRSLCHNANEADPEREAKDLSLELKLEVVCVALQHDAWGLVLSQEVSLCMIKREVGSQLETAKIRETMHF
jgi:hypothetical protein